MAVNLKAVATLNIKPYMASLKQLAAENAKLNNTVVRGSKAVTSAQERETAARERGAQQLLRNNKAVEGSTRQVSRSVQQLDRDTEAYGKKLAEVNKLSADSIATMSRMTQRQIALRNASDSLRAARQRLADVISVSRVEGDPAVASAQKALTRAETAYNKALNARRAEVYANQELAKSERLKTQAMVNGSEAAAKQAQTFKTLSNESLNLQRAKDRLAIAEARLASAYTKSSGVLTPAVAAARRELASAQIGYNNLAEAQKTAGKAGAGVASGLAAQRYLLHDFSRQLATVGVLTAAMPAAALAFSASWEKTFADVKRTADPAFSRVDTQVEALRSSLVGMAQAMPIAFKDIAEIATLANQMGIASSQTAEFSRAVAMFAATSGVSVDIAATAFGRLTSIMGDSRIGFMEMADSILKVGVNSVATEDEIINITTQISSIAQQAGMSTKDIIGLSGALASVRVPPELSRGVITRVFGQIDKAVNAGGTGLETLARISGTSAEQFRKDWGTEQSASLFNNFLRGLRDAGSAARSELNALGITSVRDVPVMLRIANAADAEGNVGELLTQTMRDANNAAGETQRQYTIMADTVVGKLKVLGNNIVAFFDAAGRSGLGVFGDIIDSATTGLRKFTRSLEEPHALMGIFGQTNGDVLGWAMAIGVAASSALLLGSAITKIIGMGKAWVHFASLVSSGALFGGAASGAGAGMGVFAANAGKAAKNTGLLGRAWAVAGKFINPWTVSIAAGAAALTIINAKMEEGATDAKVFAESLASIDVSNAASLDRVLSGLTVAGPAELGGWEMNTNPFSAGIEAYENAANELVRIRNRNLTNFWGWEGGASFGSWVDKTFKGMHDEANGIQAIDDALQHLVDGGNGMQALKLMEKLAGSGSELEERLELPEFAGAKSILDNAFDLAGIEKSREALNKFVRGELHELYDSMAGIKGMSLNAEQLFEGDFDRLGQFAQKLDEASASFINFEQSLAAGTKTDKDGNVTGFDLGAWTESMDAQVKAQKDWVANISEIAKHGSYEVIEALAEMGPAGQLAAAELAEGLAAGEPAAIAALASLEANIATRAEDIGNEVAEIVANIDWVKAGAGSDEIFEAIVNNVSQADMSRLREAGQGLGKETIAGVLEELSKTGDVDAALRNLSLAQPKVEVSVEFTESGVVNAMAGLEARIQTMRPEVDVSLDSTSTVADLRAILDDPTLNEMTIDGNLTLTEAYAQSREFQVWAAENEIDMFLGLNDVAARVTLATMVALGNGTVTMMELHALGDPAEGKIWQIVQYANGQTGFVQIDSEDGKVYEDLAYIVDAATGTVATVPLTADNIKAIEKVNAVGDAASKKLARINITANDKAARDALNNLSKSHTSSTHTVYARVVKNYTDRDLDPGNVYGRANGGIDFFANGGVRENHVAQIAPAGAMRVWAEPETGGEAYIPLAKSKRARSEAILADVANRFGMVLQPKNYKQFAVGGYYAEQQQARMLRSLRNNSVNQGSGVNETNWNMTFVNPVTRDPFEDAWEQAQQKGGF